MEKKRRVLLKLSGEALAGDKKTGYDHEIVKNVAEQVKASATDGVEIALVIGGGNFWRGAKSKDIDRVKADQIGMLATVMNAIYVSEVFRSVGLETEIFTPFACGIAGTLFSKDKAVEALQAGKIVFFAGGTGHPYFSTDTGVALRAIEMDADEILLAKNVDGVYDSDPGTNPNAKKYDTLTLTDMVEQRLKVIDLAASVLCMENNMPLAVFGLKGENSIYKAMKGQITGTRVTV